MAGLNLWEILLILIVVILGSTISSQLVRLDLIKKIEALKLGPIRGPRAPRGIYHFEIASLGQEYNDHETVRKDTLNFEHNGKQIHKDRIYFLAPNPLYRIINYIKGIKARFLVIFLEGETEALKFKTPDISPDLLKIVDESGAVKKALKDEFKEAVNVRQLFFILIIIIVAVVVYMAMTGGIPI